MGFTDTEQLQGCYVDKQQRGEAETNLHMYTITVVEFDFKPYAGVTFIKEKYTFLLLWLQKSYFNMHVNIYLQLHDHDVYMCASYVSLFCYRKARKLSNCWHKPAKHWLSPSAYVSNTIYPPPSWLVHLWTCWSVMASLTLQWQVNILPCFRYMQNTFLLCFAKMMCVCSDFVFACLWCSLRTLMVIS